jgi:hypothetical protein
MVFARSCAVSAVAAYLAVALDRQPNSARQQLREFCYESAAKAGAHRQEIRVESCFRPLLGWIISRWEGCQLALALDATTPATLRVRDQRRHRGCPSAAWTVLAAARKAPGEPMAADAPPLHPAIPWLDGARPG